MNYYAYPAVVAEWSKALSQNSSRENAKGVG